uniref:Sulfhydryl oxidase n=1 Tax=Syphacia muris TaxID=451379 RepID=A0A0N5A7N8_9BILA
MDLLDKMRILALILLLYSWHSVTALLSSMRYNPIGSHPKLYTPGVDPIMHLDALTFDQTVFGQSQAFMVEFYADWCGHCRGFSTFFREFAHIVEAWDSLVSIAAINCADMENMEVCSKQGISGYPMSKYYPRNARSSRDALLLDTVHSVPRLKSQLARMILNEYNRYRYPDWPNFQMLYSRATENSLWDKQSPYANLIAVFVEQYDNLGTQFILDMLPYKNEVAARRAMSSFSAVRNMRIASYPFVIVFRRGNQDEPVYAKPYTYDTIDEILDLVSSHSRPITTTTYTPPTTTHAPVIDCEQYPERCRSMFYASETDMLKSMRMALLDEVIRSNGLISYGNFTALFNFVDLLAEMLKNSQRARLLFQQLRQFLFSRFSQQYISTQEWERQFLNVERLYDHPFPTNASWQHCKGTSPEFRGYTCGLWTAFHAITVHAYMDTIKENIDPLKPLNSIKGWVESFFGCIHCRQHFRKMTTRTFPLNSKRVRRGRDMVFYLWRAHNIVNARLHGDTTEDPQFEKRQFPPAFLCPTCYSGGQFSRRQVRNFLLRYYGGIKPHYRLSHYRRKISRG